MALLSLLVLGLYTFPTAWYRPASRGLQWLSEAKQVENWRSTPVPLSESAEAQVGADAWVNAKFTRDDGQELSLFSAKRYAPSGANAAVFAHTPDRCWTISGWRLELVEPEVVEVLIGQTPMRFERRLFRAHQRAELVYFGAVLGGRPVPFRLDQYLPFGLRTSRTEGGMATEAYARAGDGRFWAWMWNCFRNRLSFNGAAHFIRVSTPVLPGDLAKGDQLLQEFLRSFLQPTDFATEFREWKAKKGGSRGG